MKIIIEPVSLYESEILFVEKVSKESGEVIIKLLNDSYPTLKLVTDDHRLKYHKEGES